MSKKTSYILAVLFLIVISGLSMVVVYVVYQHKQELLSLNHIQTVHTKEVLKTPLSSTVSQEGTQSSSTARYYKVVAVVDGDTIKINKDGTTTVRIIGIDTPETVDPRKPVECFGKEASQEGKSLLLNSHVRIEMDSTQSERDIYGRLLAYVYRDDGLFYNEYMITEGYAQEYTYKVPYIYQTQFKKDEQEAKENNRGLWSPQTCNGNTSITSKTVVH